MKKIIIFTLGILFLFTSPAFSKMRGGTENDGIKMPHGKWWRLPAVKEKLKITDDEQKKLDNLYTDSRRKMIDLKADVEKAKLELELILDSDSFSKKASINQFKALQSSRNNLASVKFSFIVEARDLLGKERFYSLNSMRKDLMKRLKGKKSSVYQNSDLPRGKRCPRQKTLN